VSDPAVAVAPTSKYGETVLVLSHWGIDRVMKGDPTGLQVMIDDGSFEVHDFSDTLPFAIKTGDRLVNAIGPLAYTFDRYKIALTDTPVITPVFRPLPRLSPQAETDFAIATFNAENLFDFQDPHPSDPPRPSVAAYKQDLAKMADTVVAMGMPTIVALQEVENVQILDDLARQESLSQFDYQPVLIEGTDSRGIDVGFLVRGDRAMLEGSASYPAPEGLTSRPPLLITVTLHLPTGDQTIYVLNNHFTSMAGGEEATAPRREAQAAWNATLVRRILDREPDALIAVTGDLNSFYRSRPLDVLRETDLRHVYEFVQSDQPYTYIFEGESETLDHILVTEGLYRGLSRVEALHINADWPPTDPEDSSARRASDHDPLIAVFSLAP
jgi:predicted extracellular nuclease